MEQSDPDAAGAKPAAAPPALRIVAFPDGSGHVGVADGWTTSTLNQGVAMLTGPGGAAVTLGVPVHLFDPRSPRGQMAAMSGVAAIFGLPVEYTGDPVQTFVDMNRVLFTSHGGQDPQTNVEASQPLAAPPPATGATLAGTETMGGAIVRFTAAMHMLPPSADGSWLVILNVLSAPDASFNSLEPTMTAIMNSYAVTDWAKAASAVKPSPPPPMPAMNYQPPPNLAQNMASFRTQMNTEFQNTTSIDQKVQSAIDTSAQKFIGYIES